MVALALQELNLGSDILIYTINFQFGCNLAVEEEERVQTRVARLGGWLASWGATLVVITLLTYCSYLHTQPNNRTYRSSCYKVPLYRP